jgi:hypothetical protein
MGLLHVYRSIVLAVTYIILIRIVFAFTLKILYLDQSVDKYLRKK